MLSADVDGRRRERLPFAECPLQGDLVRQDPVDSGNRVRTRSTAHAKVADDGPKCFLHRPAGIKLDRLTNPGLFDMGIGRSMRATFTAISPVCPPFRC